MQKLNLLIIVYHAKERKTIKKLKIVICMWGHTNLLYKLATHKLDIIYSPT